MAYEFSQNILISGLTLEVNPEQYTKSSLKMGSFKRTIGGILISQDVSPRKYIFTIEGLTQSQIDDIQRRAAIEYGLSIVDFVPISERGSATRTVYEHLSTTVIDGVSIVHYIPTYVVGVIDYKETYEANAVVYTLIAEEI